MSQFSSAATQAGGSASLLADPATAPPAQLPGAAVIHPFPAGPGHAAAPLHLVDVTMLWAPTSGGVARYLKEKQRYLRRAGSWRHTILVPGRDVRGAQALPGWSLPLGYGYRFPLRRAPARTALEMLQPDLIEAGDPYQLAWSALAAGSTLGVPVVAFCHSDLPSLCGRTFGRHSERAAAAYLRRLYEKFDLVFAASRTMANRLRDIGLDRVIVQPLGVDSATFRPSLPDRFWRWRLGLDEEARLLLYVGRFAPEKNLSLLASAVSQLGPNYYLVAIGAGPCPPTGPRVLTLPYEADQQRLAAMMASADLLVHAGDQETFGLVALEAMACGLPVVASAASGLGELVDDSVGIAVPEQSAQAYAAAIVELDRRDRTLLARAARARALQYDWQRVLPRLTAHYHQLLGHRASCDAAA